MKQLLRNTAKAFLYPKPFIGLRYVPRFLRGLFRYRSMDGQRQATLMDLYPCLLDWTPSTGFDAHYFYQGAWLARRLSAIRPERHVDIGSDVRVIGVLSGFVPTEFVDFRPLQVGLNGLVCRSGNITDLPWSDATIASLSCLHVVEHVGLGRYGDPIDPEGSKKAFSELARVLSSRGRLYLTVPVGRERVCFNAHRVFSPQTVVREMPSLRLMEFSFVDDQGRFREGQELSAASGLEYGCGMFLFEKPGP